MRLRSGNNTRDQPNDSVEHDRRTPMGDGEEKRSKTDGKKSVSRSRLRRSIEDTPLNRVKSEETNGHAVNNHAAHQFPKCDKHSREEKLVPHRESVVLLLKLGAWFLISMYFIVPAFIKLNPWFMAEMAFLHRLTWPPFLNLSDTRQLGLNQTISFKIKSDEGHSIGAWHMLPKSFAEQGHPETQKDFTALLGKGHPIIMYSHGQAGTRAAWHRVALYKKMALAGFHVIAYDYRGYGDSDGYPTEAGLIRDSYTVLNWIRTHSANSPVYLWGHSMGTGVTTQLSQRLCKEGISPNAVILESPFTNIFDAAANYPLTIPFTFMPWYPWVFVESIRYNNISFPNDQSILDISVPILVLHAKDDAMVSYSLGHKLFEIGKQSKRKIQMFSFDSSLGYGHKHIHKDPELMSLIRDFTNGQEVNNTS